MKADPCWTFWHRGRWLNYTNTVLDPPYSKSQVLYPYLIVSSSHQESNTRVLSKKRRTATNRRASTTRNPFKLPNVFAYLFSRVIFDAHIMVAKPSPPPLRQEKIWSLQPLTLSSLTAIHSLQLLHQRSKSFEVQAHHVRGNGFK
jgi:hypothetical protein